MKKLLSILLVLAMMLSLVIVATLPTAAVDGDWTVVAQAKQENGEIDEQYYGSVAGYEYTEEGFRVIPANWAGQTPWARFVSRYMFDLKDGVYMEIRIDEFDYNAHDAWFNVMLTDIQYVTPGEAYEGDTVQNIIRPTVTPSNTTTWYTSGGFKQAPYMQGYENVPVVTDDNGKHNLTVEIAWDDANATFTYTINGVSAPQVVIDYMNETWGGDNSDVYVGFCLQHNEKGGKVACTLLKYGTSADCAVVPAGDDSQDPIDYSNNYVSAPVVDNPTFEYGQPGIFMNGSLDSNIKNLPGSCSGERIDINDDGSVTIIACNSSTATGLWTVENATSYAIEDLPIAMMVTRNLCTCIEEDKIDGRCGAYEESVVYLMTGDTINASYECMATACVPWDSYYVGEDSYLYFMLDASDMSAFSGRINSIRFDVKCVNMDTPGANVFDICFVAFFATEDDAIAYFESCLTDLGWQDPDAEEETTEEPEGPIEEECLEFQSNGGNTCTVVGIGSCTSDCITIPTVSPDGELVVGIGDSAFYGSSITEIIIPDSVTSIGSCAFYNTGLESVEIPDSVTSIGEWAFGDCADLKSITVDYSNPNYCSVGGNLFDKAKTTLIQYAVGKTAKKYTIPHGVTSIGSNAFSMCTSLESIHIPNSVISVGDYAFYDCTSLESIELPDSVTHVGSAAFSYCASLESIEIPDGVASVGDYTFYECTNLESIVIPDGVISIGDYTFYYCTSLETVYYTGTEEQWAGIRIGSHNSCLTNATVVYNYGSEDIEEETSEETMWETVAPPTWETAVPPTWETVWWETMEIETFETVIIPDIVFPEDTDDSEISEDTEITEDTDDDDRDDKDDDDEDDDKSDDEDDDDNSNNIGNAILNSFMDGCGSAVGFGAVTMVATISAAGFVLFKKKKEK